MTVLELVACETRRVARLARLAGAFLPLVIGLAALSGAAALLARGRWLALPAAMPVVLWIVVAVVLIGSGRAIHRRLRARTTAPAVASAIEHEQDLRRGSVTGLLEVAESGGAFAEHASRALGDRLSGVVSRPAPRHLRRLRGAAVLSLIAFAQVLAVVSVSWARRPDGWRALMNPLDAWRGTLLPPLQVAEYPERVARGGAVQVGVLALGRPQVAVRWRAIGSAWRDTLLRVDGRGRAAFVIPAADADLVLVADDGRTESDSVHISVVDRPFVGEVVVRAEYPAYLGRTAERLAHDEPLRVPAGATLVVSGQASEAVSSAGLVGSAGTLALRTNGITFSGRFSPRASGEWRWAVEGAAGSIDDVPPPLRIEVVADSVPRAEILSPVGEVYVLATDSVALEALAQDDNALSGVWLRTWVRTAAGENGATQDTPLSAAREPAWVGTAAARLSAFTLRAGDALVAVLVARDAAPGLREGVSAELILRVPTAEQAREVARETGDAAVTAADAAARAQAELAERTATEARTRSDRDGAPAASSPPTPTRPREPLTFEGAERARDIAAQQRELQERIEELQQAAAEMEERLRRAGALDPALAQQLRDAQRLLQEAMTPEMAESLAGLEQATQELDGERTRQSLAELAAQQQRLRETLEKSAELLRRAALEGALQTTADRGRELAEEQRAFADSAQTSAPDPQRAGELEREARQLGSAAEQLSQRLEQAGARPGATATEQAAAAAQQSAEELARSPSDRTAASRAASAMERSAESLQQARNQQVTEWKQELTDALDRSVQEMLQMAREQDALAERTRQDPGAPSTRAEQSALQQGVQAAQERLNEQGRRSALVSPRTQELVERARQRTAQATREAAAGQRGQTEQAMRESADALRQAAAQLTRDRERAAAAQSATGMQEMLEQMQQLAQQQGALNGQLQGLLPGGRAGQSDQGLDAAGREQARALARAQREVARQLEEVSNADPSGRAQELAREARALAQALDQGAFDPAQAARQERLLRRMLDAGRSLEQEQRDESARRESRTARGTARVVPGREANGRAAERYRVPTWAELRGLSAEDRRVVIEYFRRLNAEPRP